MWRRVFNALRNPYGLGRKVGLFREEAVKRCLCLTDRFRLVADAQSAVVDDCWPPLQVSSVRIAWTPVDPAKSTGTNGFRIALGLVHSICVTRPIVCNVVVSGYFRVEGMS